MTKFHTTISGLTPDTAYLARVRAIDAFNVKSDWSDPVVFSTPSADVDVVPTSSFNVMNFGAVGDGVTDDTVALQNAFAAAHAVRGQLLIPAGRYKYSASIGTITVPMSVRGAGWKATKLIPDPSYSGYALTVQYVNRNGEEQDADTAIDLDTDLSGVELEGFEIVALSRETEANGILFQGPVDLLRMRDISIRFLAGRALYFGAPDPANGRGFVRESYVNNVRVVHCGTPTLPVVEIAGGAAVVKATASSATSTTLVKTASDWTTNAYANYQVRILSGTGVGQVRTISSNTSTTLTVSSSWSVTPDNTSVFGIYYAQDGTNQMVFDGLWLVYNDGPSLFVNASNENEVLRRITFNDLMLHGNSQTGTSHAHDLCVVQGRIQNIMFNNVRTNGSYDVSGTKYACLRVKADPYGTNPVDVALTNWYQTECAGDGIVVEAADVFSVTGQSSPTSIDGKELIIGSAVGSVGHLELNAPSSATRKFDLNATYLAKGQTRVAGTGRGHPSVFSGSGTPEGTVKAAQGSLFLRTDGTDTTAVYAKTSGSDLNTGWAAVDGPQAPYYFDITRYGAVGNGTTDCTAAIQAASDAAQAAGGGVVYAPAGKYKVTDKVYFRNNVDLVGAGRGSPNVQTEGTKFILTAAGASLVFGDYIYTSTNFADNPSSSAVKGSYSGHFGVDATATATTPVYFGLVGDRIFTSITSYNSAGPGFLFHASQNNLFMQLRAHTSAGHAYEFDFGFAGNTIVSSTCHRPGGSGVAFKQTNGSTSVPNASPRPLNNTFVGCLFERMTSTSTAVALVEAGDLLKFIGTNFVVALLDADETASSGIPCVKVNTSSDNYAGWISLTNCRLYGVAGNTKKHWGIQTAGSYCQVACSGLTSFYNLDAIAYSTSSSTTSHHIVLDGQLEMQSTANVVKSGSASNMWTQTVRVDRRSALRIEAPDGQSETTGLIQGKIGDESYPRVYLKFNALEFTDGATPTGDVKVTRFGANRLELKGAIEMPVQTSAASARTDKAVLYSLNDGSGKTHLLFKNPDGVEAKVGRNLLFTTTYFDDNNHPLDASRWSALSDVKEATVDSAGTLTVGSTLGYMASDGFHSGAVALTGSAQQLPAASALIPQARTSWHGAFANAGTLTTQGNGSISAAGTGSSVSAAQNSPKGQRYTSSGSAGVAAGATTNSGIVCRGASTDWAVAGFEFTATIRPNDSTYDQTGASTGSRIAVGMGTDNNTIALATTLGSDTLTGSSFVGFVRRSVNGGSSDTNWQLLASDATNASTSDTSLAFTAQHWYTFAIGCKPGGSTFYWKATDHTAGTSQSGSWAPTYLPATSTLLSAIAAVFSVNATARTIDINHWLVVS